MKRSIFILIIIVVGGLILVGIKLYSINFQTNLNKEISHEMRGHIIQADSQFITVEGSVISSKPGTNYEESKTIKFKITPTTVLKSAVIVISSDQLNSGKAYNPKVEERSGFLSDLVANTRILSIKSKNNLFEINNATAQEVYYMNYDFSDSFNQ